MKPTYYLDLGRGVDMKDIVIIANFCRDFSENDNGRFMYLCKELSKDNKVEIITSDFEHTAKKHKKKLIHNWPFTITFLHEPGYRNNISIQRFASHWIWGNNVAKYIKKRLKPDVIYCAVPSLTAPFLISKYCKKNDVRFVIDIQDLWPEAFQMVFKIPIVSDILFFPFRHIADVIYKQADGICAVSQKYVDRALQVNKKCMQGNAVYLGTSLKTFDKNVRTAEPFLRKTLQDPLWLGYCGALSASYDLPCVISAIKQLKDRGFIVPKLIVMGDGGSRAEFEAYAKKSEIDVVFTGRLPYNRMCAQLALCDMVVNPIIRGSAASIINKHGDYASAGRPVLNTQDSPEYRKLVDEYEMGLNCKNGNPLDLAEKMKILIENPSLRKAMGQNARRCAEEKFDRCISYKQLTEEILRNKSKEVR